MPRVAQKLLLETERLDELFQARSSPNRRLAERAKIVLLFEKTADYEETAKQLQVARSTVGKWCLRYRKFGLPGLVDKRRGRKPKKGQGDVVQLVRKSRRVPSGGREASTTSFLATRAGLTPDTFSRRRQRFGCNLWLDREFVDLMTDIAGFYVDPTASVFAIVIHGPKVKLAPRSTAEQTRPVWHEIISELNGKLTLLARRGPHDFSHYRLGNFLDAIEARRFPMHLHILLHGKADLQSYVAGWRNRHPQFVFHGTGSFSWMGQVARWLTKVEERGPARFLSFPIFLEDLRSYIQTPSSNSKEFAWVSPLNGVELNDTSG